jgi:glucose-6-phosphate 1-dehydrogenase
MLQLIALVAMEPPLGHGYEAIRDAKAELLRAIRPLEGGDVVRGQYAGYRHERGVSTRSTVETFAAVKLQIDTWRWAGVPFLIRSCTTPSTRRPTTRVAGVHRAPRGSPPTSADGVHRPP